MQALVNANDGSKRENSDVDLSHLFNDSSGRKASKSRRLSHASQASHHGSPSPSLSSSHHGPSSRRPSVASIAESVAQIEEKAEEIAAQRVKDFGLARGSIMNMIGPNEIKFLHRSYKVTPLVSHRMIYVPPTPL